MKKGKEGALPLSLPFSPPHDTREAGFCLLGFPLRWFAFTIPILRFLRKMSKMGNQRKGTVVEEKRLSFVYFFHFLG
jgi:hypothetical protein